MLLVGPMKNFGIWNFCQQQGFGIWNLMLSDLRFRALPEMMQVVYEAGLVQLQASDDPARQPFMILLVNDSFQVLQRNLRSGHGLVSAGTA